MNVINCTDSTRVLALDLGGRPTRWLHWSEAAVAYCLGRIAWEAGDTRIAVRGGRSRLTGQRSRLELASVAAIAGAKPRDAQARTPPLCNRALFVRDGHTCMYCGAAGTSRTLTRDHVLPRAHGGADTWTNVTTACGPCNTRKGARTPEQAGMPLIAVPYAPDLAEWLALSNRRILADQMAFITGT